MIQPVYIILNIIHFTNESPFLIPIMLIRIASFSNKNLFLIFIMLVNKTVCIKDKDKKHAFNNYISSVWPFLFNIRWLPLKCGFLFKTAYYLLGNQHIGLYDTSIVSTDLKHMTSNITQMNYI